MVVSGLEALSLETLKDSVRGKGAAIRRIVRLQPAGGPGDKVFPASYAEDRVNGRYAVEQRQLGDRVSTAVLLDSVQSQANRLEQALLDARDEGHLRFPLMVLDLSGLFPQVGRLTALDAPHRVADAIFRDSLHQGIPFRESNIGRSFAQAHSGNAASLYLICPSALLFGYWDSTWWGNGKNGARLSRALVSEIVGYDAILGKKTASRLDPLQVPKGIDIFLAPDGGWTLDETAAKRDDKGKPARFGKEGKASEINHGNVTPGVEDGGFTIAYATQTSVLSLGGLRRLRFPISGVRNPETDRAAQAVIATLGLCAMTWADRQGYDLRSRCVLAPEAPPVWEIVQADGSRAEPFFLDFDRASRLFEQAVAWAADLGLSWDPGDIAFSPSPQLRELIARAQAQVPELE